MSIPTLQKHFDAIEVEDGIVVSAPEDAVNLLLDATFFGREYGFFCLHDTEQIIYFCEIKTESIDVLQKALGSMVRAGYRFKSFTLDGKRGFINTLHRMFPGTPIQMCHFHQKAIIRRYITNNPKTECGQELKQLMTMLSTGEPQEFIDTFFALQERYQPFLLERNENGQFVHRRLRSAFRSIKTNLPYLFIYKEIPEANIPNTTNRIEAVFSHLKEKILIHRGLHKIRKKKAAKFILKKS